MPEVIPCPTCRRQLSLPEELAGRVVRCPRCGRTFAAAVTILPAEPSAPAAPVPAPTAPNQPLNLSLDDDGPRPRVQNLPPLPRPLRPVPVGAPAGPQGD